MVISHSWVRELASAAKWIWHEGSVSGSDMAFFFHELTPPAGATSLYLLASGDNRYQLHADVGEGAHLLGRGPARSDPQHTSMDPYSAGVTPGRAVRLWAAVRYVPPTQARMIAEMHGTSPGFLCAGAFLDESGRVLEKVGTGRAWRVFAAGRAIEPTAIHHARFWIGAAEAHHAGAYPAEWLSPEGLPAAEAGLDGPPDGWQAAVEAGAAYPKGSPPYATDDRWLVMREIPQEERRARSFFTGVPYPVTGDPAAPAFPLRVPANSTRRFAFDAGEMVLAYPALQLRGRQARATLTYAEVLRQEEGGKTFRLAPGGQIEGYQDEFFMGDRAAFTFEPFHWRSFRFVLLEVTAGPEGAEVGDFSLVQTGYPFELQQTFAVEGGAAEAVRGIMDVSWRTLKCCTWETYMDCPSYEQLQYVGDTRLQALVTYTATADGTLPVQALRAFDRSRIYEGLTQSRYPSSSMQLIPTFSLIYLLMIDDYREWMGDDALVAELRPGIAPILAWFTRQIDPQHGLIGAVPYWPFVDWVEGWQDGIPPMDGGSSSLINLQYLLALEAAARIYEAQRAGAGEIHANRANALRQKIYDVFYDRRLGLLLDTPRGHHARGSGPVNLSQHAQALGVLGEVLKGAEARRAMELAMAAGSETGEGSAAGGGAKIRPASFYFRFYLAEALAKLRMGEHLWGLLAPFREALGRGVTTWPESFEPARSECHAWSAWPMYCFARHVLGVHPPDPIDGRIDIRPLHCPPLDTAEGTVATHRGMVSVRVRWETGKAQVEATGPHVRVLEA